MNQTFKTPADHCRNSSLESDKLVNPISLSGGGMESLQNYINACEQNFPAKFSPRYLGKTKALLPRPTSALRVTTMLRLCPQYPPKIPKRQPQKRRVLTVASLAMDIPVQLQGRRTALLGLLVKLLGKRSFYTAKISASH